MSGRQRTLWATAVVIAVLAGCGGGGDDGDVGTLGPFWVSTDIAAADIDGDGRTDVVSVAMLSGGSGPDNGYLDIRRQVAAGSFTAYDRYAVGRYPWRVEIGDVDGDGAPDLVMLDVIGGSSSNQDTLYLLLQDRTNRGRFLAPRVIASGLATYDFTIADINRDGAPDIVIAGGLAGADGALLLVQNAAQRGSFQPPAPLPLPGRAAQVGAGDLNGDGLTDLAFYATTGFSVAAGSSGHILIVHGQSGGGFGSPRGFAPQIGLNAQLVRIADVDGNGLPDVLVLFNPFSTDYRAKLTVLMQTSTDSFGAIDTSLSNIRGTDGFVVGDLNGDSRPDVATTGFFPVGSPTVVRSNTNLLLPIGGGAYGVAAIYEMPAAMEAINAADIDGDGLNDLVLLGGDDNRAFVMTQSRSAPGTFLAPRAL